MSAFPVERAFDAAIVLGAKVGADGSPSQALERRVSHAVALVRAGRVAHLLMSGGAVGHPLPEAQVMRELAVTRGMAPERISVEDRSRNTIENARLSAAIAAARGWRHLALVTDAYHLPRALYIFHRLGVPVAGFGARPPGGGGRGWWTASLREAVALPWTVLRVEAARLER
ncbi:MAG: YdcF family protein [Magnetospirillum sp.]|nr:YdcF family protein [Magnetospirillum sp.]